jgi:hypothetical protein
VEFLITVLLPAARSPKHVVAARQEPSSLVARELKLEEVLSVQPLTALQPELPTRQERKLPVAVVQRLPLMDALRVWVYVCFGASTRALLDEQSHKLHRPAQLTGRAALMQVPVPLM